MDSRVSAKSATEDAGEHFDVLIVGAGLSGIDAAWHLQKRCPRKSYAIMEQRETSGGTWDLFRWPGMRSDSDMYTLAYHFRPWTDSKVIVDRLAILKYIRGVASDYGIDRKIRYQHKLVAAAWSTEKACWTVEVERGPQREPARYTCGFLWMCSGYYSYEGGYLPEFSGIERFNGYVVHPQKWPENLDYAGKRVVVIGSGATAITMIPALAKSAAHVTMLQRSPSFICVYPSIDPHAAGIYRNLPPALASLAMRIKYILGMMYYYQLCIRWPKKIKQLWLGWERTILGPEYDIDKHFTPRYKPCTQRVSLAADGDFFHDIRSGKVTVVTDHIETFTETGIRLKSGEDLPADVVVTATGLVVVPLGGVSFMVDGRQVLPAKTFIYKSTMFSDVPNLALVRGYGNASWTLKADLICQYVCRVLNYMDRKGLRQCTPRNNDPDLGEEPWVEATSGYILRSLPFEPKQGSRRPWKYHHNYLLDLLSLRFGSLRDHVLVFSNPRPKQTT